MMALTAEPPKKDEKPALSDAARKELKKLEGEWQLVKYVGKDVEAEPDDPELVVVFDGAKMSVAFGSQKYTADVAALDPSTDPKCLDLTVTRPNRVLTSEAIYKLDGDTLVIADTPNGEKLRPADFDKPADARVQVMTLKRMKE